MPEMNGATRWSRTSRPKRRATKSASDSSSRGAGRTQGSRSSRSFAPESTTEVDVAREAGIRRQKLPLEAELRDERQDLSVRLETVRPRLAEETVHPARMDHASDARRGLQHRYGPAGA